MTMFKEFMIQQLETIKQQQDLFYEFMIEQLEKIKK
jgi:hypothetical protein